MTDTLDGVRQLWKEYGLNKSEGAAMHITYDTGEIKQHGQMPMTDGMLEITPVIAIKKK